MINRFFNPLHTDLMPVDRLAFVTSLPIESELFKAPVAFLDSTGVPYHDLNFKLADHKSPHRLSLKLLANRSITLRMKEADPGEHRLTKVEFNPGKVLHHHNGRVLDLEEAVTAFAIVCDSIEPLLANRGDVDLLFPGCHSKSKSFWSEIEVAHHLHDPDNDLLTAMRNMRHPAIRKKAIYHEDESVTLGAKRGQIKIIAYRKDREMEAEIERFNDGQALPIVRVEVKLSGQRLLKHLNSDLNVGQIHGEPRIVRFSGMDLIKAHREVTADLEGIACGVRSEGQPMDEKLGRWMAMEARHHGEAVEDLLSRYSKRFPATPNTIARLRKAALDEIGRMPTEIPDLFSDEMYEIQPNVTVPRLEWDRLEPRTSTSRYDSIHPHYKPRPDGGAVDG